MPQEKFHKVCFDEKIAKIIKDVVPPSEKYYIIFLELVFLDVLRKFDLNDINNSAINVLCNADVKYQEWLEIYPKYNTDVYDKYLQIICKRVNVNTFNNPKATTSQKLKVIHIVDEIYTDISYIKPELEQNNLLQNNIKYLQQKKDILLNQQQNSVNIIPENTTQNNVSKIEYYSFESNTIDSSKLNKLSIYLHKQGYIENKYDFVKAINNNLKIKWLKEPEYLVYLIYYLCKKTSPPFFKIYPKSTFYIQASINRFIDNECKLAQKKFYSDVVNKIKKEKLSKYILLKDSVEKCINETIK